MMIRVLVEDQSYKGDVLMSSPAYIEILKHFPDAELLTLPGSAELAGRYFRTVHTSWDTVGRPDIAITLHINRRVNMEMFRRRIPIRIGYWYRHGRLNIAKLCLNVGVETDGQLFRNRYRVDEVCELLERVFGWKPARTMTLPEGE